ncbi:hypothetical protein SAMN03097699_0970 [Flavobacteriaceae bacterium MAR_2010_188]|nr:hypothetical protein SAMN03097699_0970 [Flavobacteriaceae bacterium MAR_2010_188]
MRIILITLILLFTYTVFSQDSLETRIFKADSSWAKETFKFPIGFAPELVYSGFEEAVFPPGWGNQESPEFWSYAFAWKVENIDSLSQKKLEEDLKLYFDGLMATRKTQKHDSVFRTQVQLKSISSIENEHVYTGQIKLFDGFRTKKVLILNTKVTVHNYFEESIDLLLFRFSPKDFEDEIWKRLDALELEN